VCMNQARQLAPMPADLIAVLSLGFTSSEQH
ncbi:MAG: thioesterase, partial [Shewanella sp.]